MPQNRISLKRLYFATQTNPNAAVFGQQLASQHAHKKYQGKITLGIMMKMACNSYNKRNHFMCFKTFLNSMPLP